MTKLRIALAAAIVAAFSVLGLAAPAQAYPVQGLFISSVFNCCGAIDVSVQITSEPSGVTCSTLEVSATNGALVHKNGSKAPSQTFDNVTTPFSVTIAVNPNDEDDWEATTHATCTYDDTQPALQSLGDAPDPGASSLLAGGVGRFSTSLASAIQEISASGVLNADNCPDDGDDDDDGDDGDDGDDDGDDSDDGDDDDDNGGLPDTGGERLLWLLIGLLLVTGGTAVIISSRREDGAES